MRIVKNTICRLCLKKHEHLVHIFDENDNEDENEISRYINIFFAVEITKADPFSTYVCKPCWDRIISLCKDRLLFRSNNAYLQNTGVIITEEENDINSYNCHYSIKNIMSKYEGIKLDLDSLWDKNIDVKVDLSKCRVPYDLCENEVFQIKKPKKRSKSRRKVYYESSSSDNEEFTRSIALNRARRCYKRTKIFGDPFSLADENADDSDSDPVFSILKQSSFLPKNNLGSRKLRYDFTCRCSDVRVTTLNVKIPTAYSISQCNLQIVQDQTTSYKSIEFTEDRIINTCSNIVLSL